MDVNAYVFIIRITFNHLYTTQADGQNVLHNEIDVKHRRYPNAICFQEMSYEDSVLQHLTVSTLAWHRSKNLSYAGQVSVFDRLAAGSALALDELDPGD